MSDEQDGKKDEGQPADGYKVLYRMPRELHIKMLEIKSKEPGMTLSGLITRAIVHFVRRYENGDGI